MRAPTRGISDWLRGGEFEAPQQVVESLTHARRRMRRRALRIDRKLKEHQRRWKQRIPAYLRDANVLSLATTPVIYSLLGPLALLDLWVTAYQWICFPIYGIARVPRRRYFAIDRRKLEYLNAIEKVNCTFCSYANGLFAYVREVAARTELYWCPIKHARRIPSPHARYQQFFEYGDAEAYRSGLAGLRRQLRPVLQPSSRQVTRRQR